MSKAILIDAENKKLLPYECTGLESLQKAVGGRITTAQVYDNGDCIFVDDEGLMKPNMHFFFVNGGAQPFAGNGILVGAENAEGETLDVQTTIDDLKNQIVFMSRAEVEFAFASGQSYEEGEFHA